MTEWDDGHSCGRASFCNKSQQWLVEIERLISKHGFNNGCKDPEQGSGPNRAKPSKQGVAGIRKIKEKEK